MDICFRVLRTGWADLTVGVGRDMLLQPGTKTDTTPWIIGAGGGTTAGIVGTLGTAGVVSRTQSGLRIGMAGPTGETIILMIPISIPILQEKYSL
jgi:hypothetical protein